MKVLLQMLVIVALAVVGAVATRLILGPVDRGVLCEAAKLKPGEVCLESLKAEAETLLWVDARPRAAWLRDGLAGSILVTDHPEENLDALIAEAFPRLVNAKLVVVYCSDTGCGTSKLIAERLRELEAGPVIVYLHGGWRALQAAGMLKKP
jgi:rhodanese-related sulfurtransferase